MVYLLDPETGDLRFANEAGITRAESRRFIRGLRLPPGAGMFGRALTERRVVVTTDYLNDATFVHVDGADRVVREVGMRSMVVAPLIAGETTLGAFGVFADTLDAFSPADIALVRALADHAAAAIVNQRLIADLARSREALERRADAEKALREIAARISAIRDPAELLQQVVDDAARLLRADGARIDLMDPDTGALNWAYDARTGKRPGLGRIDGPGEAEPGEGISGQAVLLRRAIFTGDYLHDDRFVHAAAPDSFVGKHAIRSALSAPLLGDADPLGTLTVYTSESDAYGPDDAALIEALANQAAVAIRNARLFEALATSREENAQRAASERALREIAARITAVRDARAILHLIAAEAARILGHERVFINLLNDPTGATGWTWYSPTEVGRDDWPADEAIVVGEGVTGKAILERRPFMTGDYLADDRFIHRPGPDRYTEETGMHSTIAVPMFDGDEPLGAMLVESPNRHAFDERDVVILEALAQQASIALSNARLIEALGSAREESGRRAESERTLREIAARITAIHEPGTLLQGILDEAARLFAAERAQVDLVEPVAGLAQWTYPPGTPGSRRPGGMPPAGMGAYAIESGRGVWTGDYMRDASFRHSRPTDSFIRKEGLKSVIAAPFITDAGLVGVIQLGTSRPHAYGAADAERLEGLASQAAVALTTARLVDELARSRGEVTRRAEAERTLREIAATVTALRDPAEVIRLTIDAADALLEGDYTEIALGEEAGTPAAYAASESLPGDVRWEQPSVVPGVGISGLAYRDKKVARTGDYLHDRRFKHAKDVDAYIVEHGLQSAISAPLVTEGRAIGAMTVVSRRADAFDEDDGELLQALADQASIAVANARLISALKRSDKDSADRADAERTLREIAARITSVRDPEEILHRIVSEAERLLESDRAAINLIDETAGHEWQWVSATDISRQEWPSSVSIRVGEGVVGVAIAERRPFWTGDYLRDRRFRHRRGPDDYVRREGLHSVLAAPLYDGDVPLGALLVESKRKDAYDAADAERLDSLALQASIAITNARLIAALERSREQLGHRVDTERALRDIVARIAALQEPKAILDRIVEESRRLLGSDGAHLTVVSEDRTYLTPVVLVGASDEVSEAWMLALEFPMDGGINGLAAARGEVVWTEDYLLDPRIPHEDDDDEVAHRMGIRGMAAAPLRVPGGEVIGTLAISYREPRTIEPEHLELLQGLADHAAITLANSRLLERVRGSEARYRFLVENAPDIVFSTDASGHFTYLSESIERLLGWPVSAVQGQHFAMLVDEASQPIAQARWDELVADPSTDRTARLELVHQDGRRIPFEVRASPLVDADGSFGGIHGASRDVSDRERLEGELRESEARYRYLVKASPDVVWAVDADGLLTFMSDRLEELTGWKPEEVVGKHFEFLTVPDSMPRAAETWEAVQADPSAVFPLPISMPRKNADPIPVEIWVTGMIRDGEFVGAHGSIRDMRERERFERDLRRQAADLASSSERAHLARELHDSVTQALFSMTLTTRTLELLMDRDAAKAKEQVAVLRDLQKDALAEMRSLIFELRPGGLEQDGLVHALRTHAAAVEGRVGLPIVLEADDPDERLPIAIEDALYRIAQEALHNVVKHAGAHNVRIELTTTDGVARLAVSDDGQGFDPKSVPPGHLGLAGMRSRAERLGGRLELTSSSRGGTRVEVVVPIDAGGANGASQAP
jgi:PAS domain S-box-containing protein